MKKYIYTILFMLLVSASLVAQDVHFSQFNSTPMLVNPSLTGAVGDQRAFLNYRDQWRSVQGSAYQTLMASFESSILNGKVGNGKLAVGGFVYSDKAGDGNFANNLFSLSSSYQVNLGSNMYLSGGLQGGIGQRSINGDNFKWDNQWNGENYDSSILPSETVSMASSIIGDYAAGISWTYAHNAKTLSSKDALYLNVGLATYHVNKPKLFNEREYNRYVAHVDFHYGLPNSKFILNPASYLYVNKQSREIMFGSNVKYLLREDSKYTNIVKGAAITGGVFHRFQDAMIVSAGLEQGKYAFGVSYDINVSKLRTATSTNGAFEIFIRFINPNPFSRSGNSARFM